MFKEWENVRTWLKKEKIPDCKILGFYGSADWRFKSSGTLCHVPRLEYSFSFQGQTVQEDFCDCLTPKA